MTLQEEINKLTWHNAINKLKSILSKLLLSDSRPYKVYSALLTQTGTDAPVATILENTLGDVTFEYDGVGYYRIIGNFPINKTFNIIQNTGEVTSTEIKSIIYENLIEMTSSSNGDGLNGILVRTSIEIRVYP